MLKELTDVRLTILAGKLFQSFTTQTANAGLLTLQVALGLRTLDGWPGPLMEETDARLKETCISHQSAEDFFDPEIFWIKVNTSMEQMICDKKLVGKMRIRSMTESGSPIHLRNIEIAGCATSVNGFNAPKYTL